MTQGDALGGGARLPVPVDERRYLALAEFWLENRGNHDGRDFGKFGGAYAQDHLPVLDHELNFEFTGCYTTETLIKQANRFGETDLFAVKLAVEEALVNAIKHGNKSMLEKKVHVVYSVNPDEFKIRIVDQGPGIGIARS